MRLLSKPASIKSCGQYHGFFKSTAWIVLSMRGALPPSSPLPPPDEVRYMYDRCIESGPVEPPDGMTTPMPYQFGLCFCSRVRLSFPSSSHLSCRALLYVLTEVQSSLVACKPLGCHTSPRCFFISTTLNKSSKCLSQERFKVHLLLASLWDSIGSPRCVFDLNTSLTQARNFCLMICSTFTY